MKTPAEVHYVVLICIKPMELIDHHILTITSFNYMTLYHKI